MPIANFSEILWHKKAHKKKNVKSALIIRCK